jgi:dolichol-phosphate mannosyltransferase
VSVLHRTGKKGFGRSYIDGIQQALTEPVDVLCQMDADLSHDPRHLPDLIAATADADVVIGSRYVPGGAIVNWPKRRRILSRVANTYIRAVTQLAARDCTSGYRCWRRAAMAALPLDRFISDGYSFLVEMLFVAARGGSRIREVPITFVERREGESKVSRAVLIESAITPWRLIANPDSRRKAARKPS